MQDFTDGRQKTRRKRRINPEFKISHVMLQDLDKAFFRLLCLIVVSISLALIVALQSVRCKSLAASGNPLKSYTSNITESSAMSSVMDGSLSLLPPASDKNRTKQRSVDNDDEDLSGLPVEKATSTANRPRLVRRKWIVVASRWQNEVLLPCQIVNLDEEQTVSFEFGWATDKSLG